ncbi:hypothetical protein U9M48_002952, partial [Paspalum notatum var. saurae]
MVFFSHHHLQQTHPQQPPLPQQHQQQPVLSFFRNELPLPVDGQILAPLFFNPPVALPEQPRRHLEELRSVLGSDGCRGADSGHGAWVAKAREQELLREKSQMSTRHRIPSGNEK